jgi:hypothetical protein
VVPHYRVLHPVELGGKNLLEKSTKNIRLGQIDSLGDLQKLLHFVNYIFGFQFTSLSKTMPAKAKLFKTLFVEDKSSKEFLLHLDVKDRFKSASRNIPISRNLESRDLKIIHTMSKGRLHQRQLKLTVG